MTIEILNYRFDIKRTMAGGRFVIYRNLVHWVKEGKAWITPPNEKIGDNWEKVIEFDKDTSFEFYKSCMECLKSHLKSSNIVAESKNVEQPWC